MFQVGARLPRSQRPYGRPRARRTHDRGSRQRRKRHVHVLRVVVEDEAAGSGEPCRQQHRRQDADHRHGLATERHVAADEAGQTRKALYPERVRQHHDPRCRAFAVAFEQAAAGAAGTPSDAKMLQVTRMPSTSNGSPKPTTAPEVVPSSAIESRNGPARRTDAPVVEGGDARTLDAGGWRRVPHRRSRRKRRKGTAAAAPRPRCRRARRCCRYRAPASRRRAPSTAAVRQTNAWLRLDATGASGFRRLSAARGCPRPPRSARPAAQLEQEFPVLRVVDRGLGCVAGKAPDRVPGIPSRETKRNSASTTFGAGRMRTPRLPGVLRHSATPVSCRYSRYSAARSRPGSALPLARDHAFAPLHAGLRVSL